MRHFYKYGILVISVFLSYLFFHGTGLDQNTQLIEGIMASLMIIIVVVFVRYYYKEGSIAKQKMGGAIILGGMIMRIGYMLYTNCTLRQHDIGDFSLEGYGHAAYILKLLINKQLPETNLVQFYHPPLFHALGAVTSAIVCTVLKETDYIDLVDAAKIVSCIASCATLLVSQSLCKQLKLKWKAENLVLLLIAFCPAFFLLAGRVNNDALVTLLMTMAILYTYYWYQQPSYKHTIQLALIYGLGMMTKTSCVTYAFFTFLVMCVVVYQQFKAKQYKNILIQLGLFGIISLPLGLWYTVRNYILFKQPLGYVLLISKESRLYRGNESIFHRFLTIDITNLIKTPFADPWKDGNLSVYAVKSSLFGEFKYDVPYFIPVILLLLACLLVVSLSYAIIKLWYLKQKELLDFRIGIIGLWGIIIIFYIYFYISYPFGCTMDFRYIVPIVTVSSMIIGISYNYEASEAIMSSKVLSVCDRFYQSYLPALVSLFALFSFLMYVLVKN